MSAFQPSQVSLDGTTPVQLVGPLALGKWQILLAGSSVYETVVGGEPVFTAAALYLGNSDAVSTSTGFLVPASGDDIEPLVLDVLADGDDELWAVMAAGSGSAAGTIYALVNPR